MQKYIIIAVVLILVAGGGYGGYTYFANENASADGHAATSPEVKEEKHAKKHVDPHDLQVVQLDPMILPIVNEHGVEQIVSLVVAVEVLDSHAVNEIKKFSPRLKNAYLQYLYGRLYKLATVDGGELELNYLADNLTDLSSDVLGEDLVYGVKIQVVQQRSI